MKVGSRADYGLRALLYLAKAAPDLPVQVHVIAAQQQVPEDYLRQLLAQLRLAGLVGSVRGPHGGYRLARQAADITLAQVIEVLEGAPEAMPCRYHDKGGERCSVLGGCEIRGAWREASHALTAVLHKTTLADLAARSPAPGS